MKLEMIDLHKLYGFELLDDKLADILVFRQRVGYFNLVAIVCLSNGVDISRIVKQYTDLGYKCETKTYLSIREAHDELYRSFFQIHESKKSALAECDTFYRKQSEKLCTEYNYIEGSYNIDGVDKPSGLVGELSDYIALNDEPQLFIIEAAAGFGKTCTAYEIYRKLTADTDDLVPIFVELSKNRSAKLFRYVLLDEIDHKFRHLHSASVQQEISYGNVPLIIDGFDELISKSIDRIDTRAKGTDANDDFEEVESMLDTIVMLLTNKAKIILTSRKSSFFSGDRYEKWLNQYIEHFSVIRVTLDEPNVTQWLGKDKEKLLAQRGIPYRDLSNPVILAYLRNTDTNTFDEECINATYIVDRYFKMLLDREIERQNILLDPQEQFAIFVNLAGSMMEFLISAEERDFIALLILEKDAGALQLACNRYPNTERITIEDLAYKLAGHVLLDRVELSKDNIGFINDFVFGTLLGKYLTNNPKALIPESYINLVATAFSIRENADRQFALGVLKNNIKNQNSQVRLMLDVNLARGVTTNYEGAQFSDFVFEPDFAMDSLFTFERCIFHQCRFIEQHITVESFLSCTFIDCTFANCSFEKELADIDCENGFFGCVGHEGFEQLDSPMEEEFSDAAGDYEVKILEQFWPQGRTFSQTKCSYRTLIAGFKNNQSRQINDAIDSLKKKGFISRSGQYYYLDLNRINEVMEILGRKQ